MGRMLGCGWMQTAVEFVVNHSWNMVLGFVWKVVVLIDIILFLGSNYLMTSFDVYIF